MSDIIQLLPDSVANQIAAGEVVQRPASVVKELLENSIDSGAQDIQLIIKDAGRTLIRVIDNGSGMSGTDARMSFERHATSKIKEANDLFSIQTKGFRGEALASIAAIAHVELKTKKSDDELGTLMVIEGSVVKTQEPCSCPDGSSFSVKNLFYNVPARRQFLKSDGVETKHIIDEFQRVVLTHPSLSFTMTHNDSIVFQLKSCVHRQRIVSVFGNKYNQRLVPLEENTNILNIFGFVSKPEFAKKTRGEQFFFVNNRYIKSTYLNHAVTSAYKDLLPKGVYPMYILYMEIDPAEIDVNIHPTKTEIKFRDERSVYAIIHSAVKRSLGMFHVSPSLDFDQETSIRIDPLRTDIPIREPIIRVNPNYNPFEGDGNSNGSGGLASKFTGKKDTSNWQEMYKVASDVNFEQERLELDGREDVEESENPKPIFQIHNSYIVSQIKSGVIVIDQQRAHERILYEQNLNSIQNNSNLSQKIMFPLTIELSEGDFQTLMDFKDEINAMGLEVEEFGKRTIKISGVPTYADEESPEKMVEELLMQLNNSADQLELKSSEKLALAMARSVSIKKGEPLDEMKSRHLIDELFACETPNYSPKGNPIFYTLSLDDIKQKLR